MREAGVREWGEEVRFMRGLRAFCVFGAVLEKFLPRERKFFDLLEGLAEKAVRAAEMLDALDSACLLYTSDAADE